MFTCGWRHNSPRAVRYLARKGPQIVQELLIDRLHLPFDRKEDGNYHLCKEGGHSVHRILHMATRETPCTICSGKCFSSSASRFFRFVR